MCKLQNRWPYRLMKDDGEQQGADIRYLGWVLTGSAQLNQDNQSENTGWIKIMHLQLLWLYLSGNILF